MSDSLAKSPAQHIGRLTWTSRNVRYALIWTKTMITATAAFILLWVLNAQWPPVTFAIGQINPLQRHATSSASHLQEVFQIYPPVLTVNHSGALVVFDGTSNVAAGPFEETQASCEQLLAVHSFASSYGRPFVGEYSPPGCDFSRVTWNLTVISAGKQFDRLGSVYLGDIEVLRTSTAEPTENGIRWTYMKDMTSYMSLFKQNQQLTFDLGNLINDIYTAPFNVTLTAIFFNAINDETPADLIIPVSPRKSTANSLSVFQTPNETATSSLAIPRNTKKAIFTISATGQQDEEFWWSNVLESQRHTFPDASVLPGFSPFREVQLYIDEKLAGVAWPFPIIFTGGVVPGLWRPIVGIDAFELQEDEIDITPWLPLLCDGNKHSISVRVTGLDDNGNDTVTFSETTGDYWLVTGKVFIWLDVEGHITTGHGPYQTAPAPVFHVSSSVGKSANGTNETLQYQVRAERALNLQSTIELSNGTKEVTWSQSRAFTNNGNVSDSGNAAINTQNTRGTDFSSNGYSRDIEYGLYVDSIYKSLEANNISISATVNRTKDVKAFGGVFPSGLESLQRGAASAYNSSYPHFDGSVLSTTQGGAATYLANTTTSKSFSYGTTEQEMTLSGLRSSPAGTMQRSLAANDGEELFRRHALAVNGTIVFDEEVILGKPVQHVHEHSGDGHDSS